MKKVWAALLVLCMVAVLFTGCGKASKADLQADLSMYNTTISQFNLNGSLSKLVDRNANLLAGNIKKDSEDFKTLQKDIPTVAKDSINVIKKMSIKTSEGKKLKATYLAVFELQSDLLDQNIKAVKSGNSSDKQKAMETNTKVAGVQKENADALAALNEAIKVAK
jgi:hypothetical protein